MFVDAQVELPRTVFSEARQRLAAYARDPNALRRDSEAALRNGLQLSTPGSGSLLPIDVLSAPVRHRAGVAMLAVRWVRRESPGGERPLLDATLELTGTGHGPVRLTAVGSYRPPPHPAMTDDTDGQRRAAETTLRGLLLGVAAAIR